MASGTEILPAEEQVHCLSSSGLTLETDCARTVTFGEKKPTKPDLNNENTLSECSFSSCKPRHVEINVCSSFQKRQYRSSKLKNGLMDY